MKRGITLSLLTPENLPKQRKKNRGSRVQICIVIEFEVTEKEVNCEKNPVISVHKMHDNSITYTIRQKMMFQNLSRGLPALHTGQHGVC
jgi:hypothetical protein